MNGEFFQDELMVIAPRLGRSAYAYAVEGGYIGTEEEFAERLAFLMNSAVAGYVEGTNIILSGDLAPGSYTFAYEVRKADGTAETVTIGTYTVEDESTTKTYTVTWVVDGKTTTETYEEGEMPTFKGSTDKAADDEYTYTFTGWSPTITTVDGDKTYTAQYTQTAKPTEPSYTNLLDEVGYKEGYKMSTSSGNESSKSGADASGYIPVSSGKILRIAKVTLSAEANVNNIIFYDANQTNLGYWLGVAGAFSSNVLVNNGVYYFTPSLAYANTSYIRFSCGNIDENSIVTLGEEIV